MTVEEWLAGATMTEAEWLACTFPWPMLSYLKGKLTDRRKRRLFACSCCRLIVRDTTAEVWRRLLESAEQLADGLIGQHERRAAVESARSSPPDPSRPDIYLAIQYASYADASHANMEGAVVHVARADSYSQPTQCALLRDIFGNPFRPVAIDPAWLWWNGGTVPAIARRIYDDRRWEDMPILADALQDAGCDNADILDHCRSTGEHVRGCWVVDLLLGKG
jgi:hypothetical protein